MKKILVLVAAFGFLNASTWTCYRYVNGSPTGGFVKVSASSKQEAQQKAYEKYKKLGYKFDSINCK